MNHLFFMHQKKVYHHPLDVSRASRNLKDSMFSVSFQSLLAYLDHTYIATLGTVHTLTH